MIKVGFVGWRGMVGSVLMDRMMSEEDFSGFESYFYSTSQAGQKAPKVKNSMERVHDAMDHSHLSNMDIILSCQGGDYTQSIFPKLRQNGWAGYWIDAASTLRMDKDSIIALDPVNLPVIKGALSSGIKNYIGGNCTVSLMLMGLGGLFENGLIEWMTSMTYQAASGSGAKAMKELVHQMKAIAASTQNYFEDPAQSILKLDQTVTHTLRDSHFPAEQFGAPLAASLIPWIDRPMENGQTREEWKGFAETNKILGIEKSPIPIDGQCVRIGAMRSHSQAFTIKLKKDVPISEIESILNEHNQWVQVIENEKEKSVKGLTPAAISGTLSVPVGRIRKMNMGPLYLTAFSVGDQLLWGAAEPLRRMLMILLNHLS